MKRELVILLMVMVGLNAKLYAASDMLSGDEKTACEVILCLAASGGRPNECKGPLKKYFSLKSTRHKSLSEVRRDFLNKCPDNSNGDKDYDSLKNTIIKQDFECTAEEFNKPVHYESREARKTYYVGSEEGTRTITGRDIRVMSEAPSFCIKLASEKYTTQQLPIYTCDKKWYWQDDWDNGYTMEQCSKEEYEKWVSQGNGGTVERKIDILCLNNNRKNSDECNIYYKHVPFDKICWIDPPEEEISLPSLLSMFSSSGGADLDSYRNNLDFATYSIAPSGTNSYSPLSTLSSGSSDSFAYTSNNTQGSNNVNALLGGNSSGGSYGGLQINGLSGGKTLDATGNIVNIGRRAIALDQCEQAALEILQNENIATNKEDERLIQICEELGVIYDEVEDEKQ